MSAEPIPVELWGKDHWSTLAYVECRCVDHRGMLDRRNMRCDPELHPAHAHMPWSPEQREAYGTRLVDGSSRTGHDDWSCVDDMEAAGHVVQEGTGLHPVLRLTSLGQAICAALRAHLAAGGTMTSFGAERVWQRAAAEHAMLEPVLRERGVST